MTVEPRPFAHSWLVLSDQGDPPNPLSSDFAAWVRSRAARETFKLGPEVREIQYCCNGYAPRTYLDLGCPFYSRLSSTFSPLTLSAIRGFSGLEAAKEYVRRELRMNPDELWCGECQTNWETFVDSLERNWEFLARGVAGLVAYVPGFGTAVAFVINAAVSLAKGEPIDEAILDGVRGSLPGQPLTGAAFDVVVSVAKGRPLDEVAIAALPLPEQTKGQIRMVIAVVRDIAAGTPISSVLLDQVAAYLPPDGREALRIARELAAGGSIANAAVEVGGVVGAKAADAYLGSAALDQLLAQLPPDMRDALMVGAGVGLAARIQEPPPPPPPVYLSLGREETGADRARNDGLARRGFEMAQVNPKIMALRMAASVPPQRVTTESWRRGFDIATAAAAGFLRPTAAQDAVLDSLHIIDRINGFRAGQELQFEIAARHQNDAMALQGYAPEPEPPKAPAVAAGAPEPSSRTATAPAASVAAGAGFAALGLVVVWALWRR